jgi:hypothetical protein
MATASGQTEGVFTPGSYGLIYRASRGIPRRINAICDRALLVAYGRDFRTIDRRLVRAAIRDIGPGYLTETGSGSAGMTRGAFGIVVAALLWMILLLALYGYFAEGFTWPLLK